MISASGRTVATTCQYWPVGGSVVTDASPTADGFGFTTLGGAGLTVAGVGFSGCVTAGHAAAGLFSGGLAAGSCAGGSGRVAAHDIAHREKYAQQNHHNQKNADELPVPQY